jgi:hypothetical protein
MTYFGLWMGCKGSALESLWVYAYLNKLGGTCVVTALGLTVGLIFDPEESQVVSGAAALGSIGITFCAIPGWCVTGGSAVYQMACAARGAFRGSGTLAGLATTVIWLGLGCAYYKLSFRTNCRVRNEGS